MKRNTKLWRARKKAIGLAPTYLKTVMIAKGPYRHREPGSFGAASECVRIDPETGQAIQLEAGAEAAPVAAPKSHFPEGRTSWRGPNRRRRAA